MAIQAGRRLISNILIKRTAGASLAALLASTASVAQEATGPTPGEIARAVVATDGVRFGHMAFDELANADAPMARRLAALQSVLSYLPEAPGLLFEAIALGVEAEQPALTPKTEGVDRQQCVVEALEDAIMGAQSAAPCPPPPLALATLPRDLAQALIAHAAPLDLLHSDDPAIMRAVIVAVLDRFEADAGDGAKSYAAFLANTGGEGARSAGTWIEKTAGRETRLGEEDFAALTLGLAQGGSPAALDLFVGWFSRPWSRTEPASAEMLRRLAGRGLQGFAVSGAAASALERRVLLERLLATPDATADSKSAGARKGGVTLAPEMLTPLLDVAGAEDGASDWEAVLAPALVRASDQRRIAIFGAWARAVSRAPETEAAAAADAALATWLSEERPVFERPERAEASPFVATAPLSRAMELAERTSAEIAGGAALDAETTVLWRAVLARLIVEGDATAAETALAPIFSEDAQIDPLLAFAAGLSGRAPVDRNEAAMVALMELGSKVEAGAPPKAAFVVARQLLAALGDPSDGAAQNAVARANLYALSALEGQEPETLALRAALAPFSAWRAQLAKAVPCNGDLVADQSGAVACILPAGPRGAVVMKGDSGAFRFIVVDLDGRVIEASICEESALCAGGQLLTAGRSARIVLLGDPEARFSVLRAEELEMAPLGARPDYGAGVSPRLEMGIGYPVVSPEQSEIWIDLPEDLDGVVFFETSALRTDEASEDQAGAAPSSDPIIELYATGSSEAVKFDDDGGEGLNASLGFSFRPGGRYQLRVANLGVAGGFTLKMRGPTGGVTLPRLTTITDSVVGRATAQQLELGRAYTVEADSQGGGWFRLPQTNARALLIRSYDLLDADTLIEVYRPGAVEPFQSDDDGGGALSSRVVLMPEAGADYDLKIRNIGAPGMFVFDAQPVLEGPLGPQLVAGGGDAPAPIGLGEPLILFSDAGESFAWLSFTAPSSAPLLIETDQLAAVDTVLELWTDGGVTKLVEDDDSAPPLGSRIVFQPEEGVRYWLKARNIASSEGAFRLRIELVGQ